MIRSVITGTGSALPANCVSNADLAERVDTSDEWIVERTGIRQRYIAGEGETTSTLAIDASRKALAAAGGDADEIGLIILATATEVTVPKKWIKKHAFTSKKDQLNL